MRLKLAVLLCLAILLAAASAFALEPYLVKDIDPLPENQSSSPRGFLSLDNGIALFGASMELFDAELWRSDGTAAGTYRLTETCTTWFCETAVTGIALAGDRLFYLAATRPGDQTATALWVTGGSTNNTFDLGGPFSLDRFNAPVWVKSRGLLFFLANDLKNGTELWRSDGTRAGTFRLTNVKPNQVGSQPDVLTEFKGKVYFAVPESRGWTLWTSDGTPKGTKLVKDVIPYGLRSTGSSLIFFGSGARGLNLWRSDGTAKGTVRVVTIAEPRDLEVVETAALGGRFYFTTRSQVQGEELWASDGTRTGTRRLTNFAYHRPFHYGDPQSALLLPTLTPGSRMVFAADDGVHGIEPWVTNGTPAGTRLLRDICPGACWSRPFGRTTLGSRLIFAARTNDLGQEPWVTDGTPAGTRLLRDICPGVCESFFFGMVPLAGGLLFGASDGITQNGLQLWKTDGTPAGTTRITDFPEDVSEVRRIGAPVPGGVLYSASSRQHGDELWRTDGTVAGTSMVLDLVDRDNGGGKPSDLFSLGDRLYFLADDGLHGRELWTSDGTAQGTRLVLDNDPYATRDSIIEARTEMGGIAFLSWYTNGSSGLWRTDGTAAGTARLTPEEVTGVGHPVKASANRLFFIGNDAEHGTSLWTSDGTVAGTRPLDVQPRLGGGNKLTPYQGSIYFKVDNPGTGSPIWKSDGTPEGTVEVPFLADLPFFAALLGEFGGRLWFGHRTDDSGNELWSTDGTEAGTRMLGDVLPGPESFAVTQMFPAGSRMFLSANDELWVSDGTVAGTRKVGAARSPDLSMAVLLNSRLFFPAVDASVYELWVSDGSEAGTKLLRSAAGEKLELPTDLVAFEGRLWFRQGGKIWSTDGTSAGTVALPSTEGEDFLGDHPTPAGGRLFFSGWTPQTGHELWAVDPQ